MNPRSAHGEAGWAAIEATLLLPLALVVLGFLVVAGRVSAARLDVTAAARDAARAASLADTPGSAQPAALAAAEVTLAGHHVTCGDLRVDADVTRFSPGGDVAVTVTCTVSLADVAIPGVPGHRAVAATSVEVIDRLRGIGDDAPRLPAGPGPRL